MLFPSAVPYGSSSVSFLVLFEIMSMYFSSSFSGSLRLFFSQFSRSASDYADVIFPCGCSSVSFLKSFIQAGLVRVALSVIALGAAGTLTEVQQRWECVKVKAEDDTYSDLITSTFLS